jgi:hypothetical protein
MTKGKNEDLSPNGIISHMKFPNVKWNLTIAGFKLPQIDIGVFIK